MYFVVIMLAAAVVAQQISIMNLRTMQLSQQRRFVRFQQTMLSSMSALHAALKSKVHGLESCEGEPDGRVARYTKDLDDKCDETLN